MLKYSFSLLTYMNDKEKIFAELCYRHLELGFQEVTSLFIQRLVVLGATFSFLYSISNQEMRLTLLFYGILGFFMILHINTLGRNFINDSKREFLDFLRKDKILEFKIKKRSWFESNISYKRKY